jgi:uncharacterized membrane protein YedE/YeeE
MFPLKGTDALLLAPVFGFAFGWLLHRGRVANYDTIVNQLRLRDFTVLKIIMTALVVGGVGVLALTDMGLAKWAVRDANLLAALLGGAIFGIGMVLYGYCPGTAVAAIGSGSVHALVGAFGMVAGAIAYAFSFDWMKAHVLSVWQLGKVTFVDLTGLSHLPLYALLAAVALGLFVAIERMERRA